MLGAVHVKWETARQVGDGHGLPTAAPESHTFAADKPTPIAAAACCVHFRAARPRRASLPTDNKGTSPLAASPPGNEQAPRRVAPTVAAAAAAAACISCSKRLARRALVAGPPDNDHDGARAYLRLNRDRVEVVQLTLIGEVGLRRHDCHASPPGPSRQAIHTRRACHGREPPTGAAEAALQGQGRRRAAGRQGELLPGRPPPSRPPPSRPPSRPPSCLRLCYTHQPAGTHHPGWALESVE